MAGTWYALRSTLRRGWLSYSLLIVLLAGGGGASLAAVAGARRTASAYPRYLRASNASNISIFSGSLPDQARVLPKVRTIPGFVAASNYAGFNAAPLDARGAPRLDYEGVSIGSVDGRFFDQDRVVIVDGQALGLTRRQLSQAVAWQATITIGIALVIGVPVGVAIGRSLWIAFAESVGVVPAPTVPFVTLALVAVGVVAITNLIAAVPARAGSRTKAAVALRRE